MYVFKGFKFFINILDHEKVEEGKVSLKLCAARVTVFEICISFWRWVRSFYIVVNLIFTVVLGTPQYSLQGYTENKATRYPSVQ